MNGNSTPASPGTQAKDQERFSLLLDINTELLYEAMFLKHELSEIKKELANNIPPEQQEEKKKEEAAFNQDFTQYVDRRSPSPSNSWLVMLTYIWQCIEAFTSESIISSQLNKQQDRRCAPASTHVSLSSASQPKSEVATNGGNSGQ